MSLVGIKGHRRARKEMPTAISNIKTKKYCVPDY